VESYSILLSIKRAELTFVDDDRIVEPKWSRETADAITSLWEVRACRNDSPEGLFCFFLLSSVERGAAIDVPKVACRNVRRLGGAEGKCASAVLMVMFSARKTERDSLSKDMDGSLSDDCDASLLSRLLGC
jgi:hypothetical protein